MKASFHYAINTSFYELECPYCHRLCRVQRASTYQSQYSDTCKYITPVALHSECDAYHVVYWTTPQQEEQAS